MDVSNLADPLGELATSGLWQEKAWSRNSPNWGNGLAA
jgi:hypothetical protein